MKLLWYTDAIFYGRHGSSMTGLVYKHMPLGALPIAYNEIIYLPTVKVVEEIICILSQCENPNDAFENWMKRDAQFANIIFNDANKLGMKTFRVDGNSSIEEMVTKGEEYFRLLRR